MFILPPAKLYANPYNKRKRGHRANAVIMYSQLAFTVGVLTAHGFMWGIFDIDTSNILSYSLYPSIALSIGVGFFAYGEHCGTRDEHDASRALYKAHINAAFTACHDMANIHAPTEYLISEPDEHGWSKKHEVPGMACANAIRALHIEWEEQQDKLEQKK